jgi:hypothetical protein
MQRQAFAKELRRAGHAIAELEAIRDRRRPRDRP